MTSDFEELAGSPKISITQQGAVAVRTFRVAWDQWADFARTLIGNYRTVGGQTHYEPPLQFPGLPNLLVWDLTVEPFDPDSPAGAGGEPETVLSLRKRTNSYSAGAKLTATYRTVFEQFGRARADLPNVPDGSYLMYQSDLGAEFQPVPGRVWRWSVEDSPQVPDDVQPALLIPTGTIQLTWLRVLQPPWNAIQSLRGKVNGSTFISAPAGTVLFLGARATREFQFLQESGFWKIEYTFAEQSKPLSGGGTAGWNHFYRQENDSGQHWVEIKDASNNPPYAAGNFSALFQYG